MLSIMIFEAGGSTRESLLREVEWHIGNKTDLTALAYTVQEVQADGHELELIRYHFKNIPDVPNRRVVRWRGEMAAFIVSNLGGLLPPKDCE